MEGRAESRVGGPRSIAQCCSLGPRRLRIFLVLCDSSAAISFTRSRVGAFQMASCYRLQEFTTILCACT